MAATSPVEFFDTRIGSPSSTVPFMLRGTRSALEQAGYQKPNNGAPLEDLISVIKSSFISGKKRWPYGDCSRLYPAKKTGSRSFSRSFC
jgi:hypothetical protein